MNTRPKVSLSVIAFLLFGGLVGCSGDDGVTEPPPNEAPTATIASPADGDMSNAGEDVTFDGSAEDPEDGTLTGDALVWDSDLDGQIGTGETFTINTLSAGDHTITLTATDSDGATGTASIGFTVKSQSPSATITSPAEGATFAEGDQIDFQGSADDPQDGALTGTDLVWTSDLDGQLGTGESFSLTTLSIGDHTITLTATDSDGNTGTATVSITVQTNQPSASITSPSDGATFIEGEDITFEGSGSDPQDGALTGGSLVWTSDADGQIGTGETFTLSTLSVGTHTITLTATDSDGNTATATVSITVEANDPPAATITSPADGSTFLAGTEVTFEGSGSDPQDGALTGGSLVWDSDLDGQIGTGETFTKSDLSIGTHVITLTATDAQGLTGTDQVTITVDPSIVFQVDLSASSTESVGAQFMRNVEIDMSNAGSLDLASAEFDITWDPAVVSFVSAGQGEVGTATINDTDAANGNLTVSWFSASGQTTDFTMMELTLEGAAAGTTTIDITVTVAADESASSVLSNVTDRDHEQTIQ